MSILPKLLHMFNVIPFEKNACIKEEGEGEGREEEKEYRWKKGKEEKNL